MKGYKGSHENCVVGTENQILPQFTVLCNIIKGKNDDLQLRQWTGTQALWVQFLSQPQTFCIHLAKIWP